MLRDVNLPMEAEKMTSQDAAHIDAVPPAPAPGLTPATEEKPATGVKGQSKEERNDDLNNLCMGV